MASKRRLRRQKLAAARDQGIKMPAKEKIRVKWDAQNGKWVDSVTGIEVTNVATPPTPPATEKEKPKGTALFLYNVAVQKGAGKDILVNEFMAPSDEKVLELICKHHSMDKEDDFTILDIHKVVPNGIVVVRETEGDWPKNVRTITNKGIIMSGQWATIADARREALKDSAVKATAIKAAASATAAATTAAKVLAAPLTVDGEKYIPRVRYTLLTGS